jgi:hypothetical protein
MGGDFRSESIVHCPSKGRAALPGQMCVAPASHTCLPLHLHIRLIQRLQHRVLQPSRIETLGLVRLDGEVDGAGGLGQRHLLGSRRQPGVGRSPGRGPDHCGRHERGRTDGGAAQLRLCRRPARRERGYGGRAVVQEPQLRSCGGGRRRGRRSRAGGAGGQRHPAPGPGYGERSACCSLA